MFLRYLLISTCLLFSSCQPADAPVPNGVVQEGFEIIGQIEFGEIDEASGLQAGSDGVYFVHNDEGARLFAMDGQGRHLGSMKVKGAKNRDWEDLTRVPGEDSHYLVIGDTGDNHGRRKKLHLYFIPQPAAGQFDDDIRPEHKLIVRLPHAARDIEALAYDASGDMLLFLSKRDEPPRLYGVARERALSENEVVLEFLGEVPGFRPPTRRDILTAVHRGLWVSQPTGMDISRDGRLAAIITYRSLYLFERNDDENWIEAFQRAPVEYLGPPGFYDEAVAFSADGRSILVTTERRPAPVSRLELPEPEASP